MANWPWLVFATVIGACVGSFLNVVIYRLPAGQSLVKPPSHCPKCDHGLAWFENVPVLGWLWLRGKCRHCGQKISVQYPLIEATCAILFGGLFAIYYMTGMRPDFSQPGLGATWVVLAVQLVMVAGLLAATMIDARLYIIPISIPWTVAVVALVVLPLAAVAGLLPRDMGTADWSAQVAPVVGMKGIGAAVGGAAGLLVALVLMRSGVLPRSFDEMEEEIEQEQQPDAFLEHPHPRREVLKELVFVLLPLAGIVLGGWLMPSGGPGDQPALVWRVLAGVSCGYLTGGGFIWGTRILGTLGFGREAMGLGDVHLLAAIGAVLGPVDVVFVFFVAPFLGLVAALAVAGLSALVKGQVRVIPYGPYLAAAAVVVMIFRQPLLAMFNI